MNIDVKIYLASILSMYFANRLLTVFLLRNFHESGQGRIFHDKGMTFSISNILCNMNTLNCKNNL
jgi:hypothetical protein